MKLFGLCNLTVITFYLENLSVDKKKCLSYIKSDTKHILSLVSSTILHFKIFFGVKCFFYAFSKHEEAKEST